MLRRPAKPFAYFSAPEKSRDIPPGPFAYFSAPEKSRIFRVGFLFSAPQKTKKPRTQRGSFLFLLKTLICIPT